MAIFGKLFNKNESAQQQKKAMPEDTMPESLEVKDNPSGGEVFTVEPDLTEQDTKKPNEKDIYKRAEEIIKAEIEENPPTIVKLNDGTEIIVTYEEDGVYINLAEASSRNTQAIIGAIANFAKTNGVVDLNIGPVIGAVSGKGPVRAKIAPPQKKMVLKDTVEISVRNKNMLVMLTLKKTSHDSEYLETDEVLSKLLNENNVSFGLDESIVRNIIENRVYDTPTVVATGKLPEKGEDGKLIWHFETNKDPDLRLGEIDDSGKIDHKNLDLFIHVDAGQLLLERTQPTPGFSGSDVCGTEIPAKQGRDAPIPRGKSVTWSEDRSQLFAEKNGMVDVINDIITVSDCYNVRGNADMSVGNINFDGNIIIGGNVISGLTIKATGSILIEGIVEGSNVEAGLNVVIKGGIQGAGKAHIGAGGDITAKFIEYSTVMAKGKITADNFIHSNIVSESCIELLNGRGCIIGGNTNAAKYIVAKVIGTPSGIQSFLETGVSMAQRDRASELSGMIQEIDKKIAKINSVTSKTDTLRDVLNAEQQKVRATLIKNMLQLNNQKKALASEYDQLNELMTASAKGLVHVTDKIFPGVKITIGPVTTFVREELDFVTFKTISNEIETVPCMFAVTEKRKK